VLILELFFIKGMFNGITIECYKQVIMDILANMISRQSFFLKVFSINKKNI